MDITDGKPPDPIMTTEHNGKEVSATATSLSIPEYKPENDKVLADIASEATVGTEWPTLRDVCKGRLVHNMTLFSGSNDVSAFNASEQNPSTESVESRIFTTLDEFSKAPFTIQRMCELLSNPTRHYTSSSKYLRAFERCVLVTASIEEYPLINSQESETTTLPLASSPNGNPVSLETMTRPELVPIPFAQRALDEAARSDRAQSRSRSRSPGPDNRRKSEAEGGGEVGVELPMTGPNGTLNEVNDMTMDMDDDDVVQGKELKRAKMEQDVMESDTKTTTSPPKNDPVAEAVDEQYTKPRIM